MTSLALLCFVFVNTNCVNYQEDTLLTMIKESEAEAIEHLANNNLDLAEAWGLHALELSEGTRWTAYEGALTVGQVYLERGQNDLALRWLQSRNKLGRDIFHSSLVALAALRSNNSAWSSLWAILSNSRRLDTIVGGVSTLPGKQTSEAAEASLLILLSAQPERPLIFAKRDIERALALAPENLAAFYVKGCILERDGRKVEARGIFELMLSRSSGKLYDLVQARLKEAEC